MPCEQATIRYPATRAANPRRAAAVASALVSAICAGVVSAPHAQAGGAAGAVAFAPHRAVYEISLIRAVAGSGVSELEGRMVYELSGSACLGYTQKMRFVTRIEEPDGGKQVNDLRTSSWEAGSGEKLKFSLDQYHNEQLAEATQGDADRSGQGRSAVDVTLTKPDRKDLTLKPGVVFPMQHSRALIAAAKSGERVFAAELFDGSEKGERVYFTSAVIGDPVDGRQARDVLPDADEASLAGRRAWPVAISYFDVEKPAGDALPDYELSFLFFENGISTRLMIDYGDFAIRGRLAQLTMLPSGDCPSR